MCVVSMKCFFFLLFLQFIVVGEFENVFFLCLTIICQNIIIQCRIKTNEILLLFPVHQKYRTARKSLLPIYVNNCAKNRIHLKSSVFSSPNRNVFSIQITFSEKLKIYVNWNRYTPSGQLIVWKPLDLILSFLSFEIFLFCSFYLNTGDMLW